MDKASPPRKALMYLTATVAAATILFGATTALEGAPVYDAGSSIKIEIGNGHGSGVHIGNGYILTAAHVVATMSGDVPMSVKLDDGTELTGAEVMWSNDTYDVALIRIGDHANVAASFLECRSIRVGEVVEARGNPSAIEFVSMRGYVAGVPREVGPWGEAAPTDLTVIGGMSGGGVFDEDGDVIGIAVGSVLTLLAKDAPPSITGVSLIVPSSTICALLAR